MNTIAILYIVLLLIAGGMVWLRPGKITLRVFQGMLALSLVLILFLVMELFPSGQIYVKGLNVPVAVVPDPEKKNLWFAVERSGTIRILNKDGIQDGVFFDLEGQVAQEHPEQGLLGLAFHPDFAKNGYFYVYYTLRETQHDVLERYQVSPDDKNQAMMESGVRLLETTDNDLRHHGGHLIFGPDGYLYLSIGDGGFNRRSSAQYLSNILGTIVRLDVSDTALGPPYYEIPADNPFIDDAENPSEIWVYGLRNPWRFAFDAKSGDLYIADVGFDAYEEISFLALGEQAGANLGWSWFEATTPLDNPPQAPYPDNLYFPVHEYDHEQGCAVIGGFVYQGKKIPKLQGKFMFTDLCNQTLKSLSQDAQGNWQVEEYFKLSDGVISFTEGMDGEIYLLAMGGGKFRDLYTLWDAYKKGDGQ